MEESFELLSSMSPKVKGRQKHFRKGATLLALKKHIRRSSIFDSSVHTVNNEEVIAIEGSSTTDSQISANSKPKLLNESPIVISDTDFSDIDSDSDLTSKKEKEQKQVRFKKNTKTFTSKKHSAANSFLLSKDKLNDIRQWIKTVNVENDQKENVTVYSELSTIYGDEIGGNFNPEGIGCAINSTFVGRDCRGFDELFKNKKQNNLKTDHVPSNLVINNDDFEDEIQSFNDLVIEESFIDLNGSLTTRLRNKNNNNKNTPKHIKTLEKKSQKSMVQTGNDNEMKYENDLVTLLDDLYGDKWREEEEHVLPKTEPRKRLPRQNDFYVTNTERKPKLSVLYKNPYTETEKTKSSNLKQSLHKARTKLYLESPLVKKLNDLCDSETNSESSCKPGQPRIKLNFDDCDSEHDNFSNLNNVEKTSKYFKKTPPSPNDKLNKESDEFDALGGSLKERILKKYDINILSKENKNNTKDGTNVSVSNKALPLKEKLDEKGFTRKNNIPKIPITDPSSSGKNDNTKEKTDRQFDNTSISSTTSDETWEKQINKIEHETKAIKGKYSFLASLSANVPIFQCDMLARIHRNNFKMTKDQLLKKLFKLYNERIFDGAIPQDTLIEWNDRLRGTAGYCYCKKITRRTGAIERTAKIVLSTKVIDAAYRLRDTLVHEMCHAATWIVNCVSDGHGHYWKAWAYKAMKTFPELPPIKRCHDYAINTKYTYRCTGCGYSIGRHSKSLDIERKRCGYCMGKFEVLINKTSKKGGTKSVPATPKREATGFALFVKENYNIYKNENRKHGDVMKILGQKFQEMKVNQ